MGKSTLSRAARMLVSMKEAENFRLYSAITQELGRDIASGSTILDFCCGDGKSVYLLRNFGFNAFGVDIRLNREDEFLRLIPSDLKYRLPFDDETFDFIFSYQVLEHAKNLPEVLSEMCRVLK